MSALHVVPEPDDDEPPGAGEQPPARGPVIDLDDVADDEPGETPAPRALAFPDLTPYTSLAWVPQVLKAGTAAARRKRAERIAAGEPPRLSMRTLAADVVAGTVGLLRHAVTWLRGQGGPKSVGVPGRLGLGFLAVYCACRSAGEWPTHTVLALLAAWLGGALGTARRTRDAAPARKPGKAVEKTTDPPPPDTPDEAPEEPPAGPSPEAVVEALHALVGEGRGVLLTTLRTHLQLPDTRAVREVLSGAGIRVRPGVRTTAGNGPGVHLSDVPPLRSPLDPPQEGRCLPGQSANANANNTSDPTEKGLRADGSYWPPGKDYHFEPDPRNVHGTVIVHHHRDRP